jgi:hypothetical protein
VLDRINAEFVKVARDPALGEKLAGDATIMMGTTRQEVTQFVTNEAARWRKVVADIGLAPLAAGSGKIGLELAGRPDTARLSKRSGHKYSHGHALILSGGVGRGGAARLAARRAASRASFSVSLAASSFWARVCAIGSRGIAVVILRGA